MYTELQTGVMPTQYQGFPMKANGGAREWTEYYAAQDLRGAAGAEKLHTLHSPDYHGVAIPSVEEWLNTEKIGSGDSSLYDEVDAFLEELADRTPTEEELMHSADGWGGIGRATHRKTAGARRTISQRSCPFAQQPRHQTLVRTCNDGDV